MLTQTPVGKLNVRSVRQVLEFLFDLQANTQCSCSRNQYGFLQFQWLLE